MDGSKTRRRGARPVPGSALRKTAGPCRWWALLVCAGGLIVAGGCGSDLLLSASNLDIGPNPARPGDAVIASVVVTLVPTQRHTIRLTIDGAEHLSVTNDEAPGVLTILELGDAADLLTAYGEGEHTAQVEVQVHDGGQTARTQFVSFELQEGAF